MSETLDLGITTIPSYAGRYEVRSVLGRGGTAEVFEAVDRLLGRRVAVKVLRAGVVPDWQTVARFRREARAAASLNHPNIVTVHDVGLDGERPYIVMELVGGETLSDALLRQGRLAPELAAAVGEAIAEALACAHRAGLVHRDLKPGNVMVGPLGHVKVLDFGIAQALDRTPVDEPFGTAEYLSPEQARGGPVDARADVYALGVVLYEMLAGRPPFTGQPLAVAHRHVTEDPRPLRDVAPEVPEPLAALVHRCLRKDPADRYRNCGEVALRLGALRAPGRPGTGQAGASAWPGPATKLVPPMRSTDPLDVLEDPGRGPRRHAPRRPRAGAWILAAVALVVALVGVSLPFVLRARPVARARPAAIRPPLALSARGECGGFFKAGAALSWQASTSPVADGYVVYRSPTAEGPFEKVAILIGADTVRFLDRGLGLGERYWYRLRTTSGSRSSPYSSPASAETPGLCF